MIERFFVHNYRCFENFTLDLTGRPSALVIGRNGAGKSTLRCALHVIQNICRGTNRVREWIGMSDFTFHRRHVPMRFEVDLVLRQKQYRYQIAFEMPDNFREPRVIEEGLTVGGNPVFTRQLSQVRLPNGSSFNLDWHVGALPVISERPGEDSIQQLRSFFASLLLLAPVPRKMTGYADEEETELDDGAENFVGWLSGFVGGEPARYSDIDKYLKAVMPDFGVFKFVPRGEKGKQLSVQFELQDKDGPRALTLDFGALSDGEKCFFLSAAIVAVNRSGNPLVCFWDEPENHLSLPEVSHFIAELRRMTNRNGQFIATSHHPEAIRRFSDENTIVFTRNSHLEPTRVRLLSEIGYQGDLINAILRGEVIE
jgi:predicted ATPase